MLCCRVQNLLSAYLDRELTGAEMLEIRRHLRDCGACTRELEALQSVKLILTALPVAAPDRSFTMEWIEAGQRERSLGHRIQQQIRAIFAPSRALLIAYQRSATCLAATAALALGFFTSQTLSQPQRPDAVTAHVPAVVASEDAPPVASNSLRTVSTNPDAVPGAAEPTFSSISYQGPYPSPAGRMVVYPGVGAVRPFLAADWLPVSRVFPLQSGEVVEPR